MKTLALILLCVAPAFGRYTPFVVGGRNVDPPGKWPWQASLERDRGEFFSHTCGASIVTSTHLISAAHCLSQSLSSYRVVVGLHDKDTRAQGEPTTILLQSFVRHPGWVRDGTLGFPNDAAVIRLASPVNLDSQFIGTVQMAPQDNADASQPDYVGSECWITGWGRLYGFGPLPDVLQEAQIDVMEESACVNYWGSPRIQRYHVCILSQRGTIGACNGDSGGPLVCNVGGTWTLTGIASWVRTGCVTNFPSVYVRVSYFRDWIDQQIAA